MDVTLRHLILWMYLYAKYGRTLTLTMGISSRNYGRILRLISYVKYGPILTLTMNISLRLLWTYPYVNYGLILTLYYRHILTLTLDVFLR